MNQETIDSSRKNRISALSKEVEQLITMRHSRSNNVSLESALLFGGDYSVESIARHIRYRTGMIVDLRDDQIKELGKKLSAFYEIYKKDMVEKTTHNAKTIASVINSEYDFNDRVSYLDDKEEIQRLRFPVIRTYLNLFKDKPTLTDVHVDSFWQCLDFKNLTTTLKDSEIVKHIPKMFCVDHGIDHVKRIHQLVVDLDKAIDEQSKMIETVLDRAINVLLKGEEISLADRIDLSKPRTVSLGVVIQPLIVETVNRSWYQNNMPTGVAHMADDLKTVLGEPILEVRSVGDKTDDNTIQHLVKNVTAKDFIPSLRELQTRCITMTNKIVQTSDTLLRFCDKIDNIPIKENKGYYNYAIEDIARLISLYSSTLFIMLEFIEVIAIDVQKGIESVDRLARNLLTHKQSVEGYIRTRENNR